MKYNYVSDLKINSELNIEIEFDSKERYIYKGVSDFYINKNKSDEGLFVVIDSFSKKITKTEYELIKSAFGMKYTDNFLDDEIKGKMNLLQIEGSLTIYIMYEKVEQIM